MSIKYLNIWAHHVFHFIKIPTWFPRIPSFIIVRYEYNEVIQRIYKTAKRLYGYLKAQLRFNSEFEMYARTNLDLFGTLYFTPL